MSTWTRRLDAPARYAATAVDRPHRDAGDGQNDQVQSEITSRSQALNTPAARSLRRRGDVAVAVRCCGKTGNPRHIRSEGLPDERGHRLGLARCDMIRIASIKLMPISSQAPGALVAQAASGHS